MLYFKRIFMWASAEAEKTDNWTKLKDCLCQTNFLYYSQRNIWNIRALSDCNLKPFNKRFSNATRVEGYGRWYKPLRASGRKLCYAKACFFFSRLGGLQSWFFDKTWLLERQRRPREFETLKTGQNWTDLQRLGCKVRRGEMQSHRHWIRRKILYSWVSL